MSPSTTTALQFYKREISLQPGQQIHLASGQLSKPQHFPKHPARPARYLFRLQSGILKILTHNQQEPNIKFLVTPNQFFGELALAKIEQPDYFAQAAQNALIEYFDLKDVHQLMLQDASFNREMLVLISQRIEKLETRLDQLIQMDSRTRVVQFLRQLARDLGTASEENWIVPNFLKNKEVAQLTFTSRQTVNSVMNELKKSGQIDFDSELIFIKKNLL